MAEPPTIALDLQDIPEYKSPRIPSPSIDLAKLALDVVASSGTLFATKRKHFKAYKCISGAELVDCVCRILTVTRPRATDYCEQMRVKLHLFSFPDKKKPFRDDKNSYFAFKDTSKSLLTVSQPGRLGRSDAELQSSSEASFTEMSTSMASTNTTSPLLPPSSSTPIFASNSLTVTPDEKQRKNKNNPTIKVARASSWASLVDLPPSQEPSEVDPHIVLSPSSSRPISNTNQLKRENSSLSPKDDAEKSRRGSISSWHDKDRRRKRESKKFSRFVLASIPDKLDGSNFNGRSTTRIMAPGYTVSNFNNIGTLIVTDLLQTYLVSVNNKSGLVSVAYQHPYIMSYHENHKLQIYDIRTEHVKYIYEDPKNYRKLSRDSLKKSDSPVKSRRKASGDRSHSPSKRDLITHENVTEGRDRSATLTPIMEREMSTRSMSKKGSLKMSSTEPTLLKTDADMLAGEKVSGSAPALPVARNKLVDMANPHASDLNKSALQSLHLSDNEIIEKNRGNCLLLAEQKLVLLTCYQTFYRLLTWSITREEVLVNLKSPRDTISDAGSYEESEPQSQQSSKDSKKKDKRPREHDFISMLSELDFFSMKDSRDKKEKDKTDQSGSTEYENVINFDRKCYLVNPNILQPVDHFCKLISRDRLLIGSHYAWQVWNTISCKLEKEGELKEEGTSLIKLHANNECVAGATIDTIYIWFLAQANDEPVVIRHHTIITEMHLDQKYVFFGDRNGTVCVRRLTHLLLNPQNPANMYYFNTANEAELNTASASSSTLNPQEPVIVRASYYENKINVIQKQGPNLLVGHESSKFTVWRIEDGSSEADVNGGSGTSSLTTSNNSNSIAPVNGSPVPVNTTPIGSPGTGYSLAERARGLETPLRVYLIKEYSTNGPVLDINCDEEGCYFLVRNKRKNAPLEASKLGFYGLGKKIKGDNVILTGPVDMSSKNKNKKDKLQAVNTRLDQVEKTNDDILSNLDRIEKSDRERSAKLENELNTWGQTINNKLESQLNVLNRLKPAFDYVVQFQQMQQQLGELTNANRVEGQSPQVEGTLSGVSSPSTSMEFSSANIKSLLTKLDGNGSANSPPQSETIKTPKPRDILSSFHRVTTLFKHTVDEQAKEIEVLKATVSELRDDRQKQTREIEELKNTVQLLVQFVQQGANTNVLRTSAESGPDLHLAVIDESHEDKQLQQHNDNASHTSALDHETLEHHHDDNRSVVSDAYSVFSDKRMARVMEEMAQMTDQSSQVSDHPNMDDVSEHHEHQDQVPMIEILPPNEAEKPSQDRDDKSVISVTNDSVKNHDTTEELNDRHVFLDELREEEEDDNDESTWASKSVSTARSDMSSVFEIDADSTDHYQPTHGATQSDALSFSLTPLDVFNTLRTEANLSSTVDLNIVNHEQLYKTVLVPVNPPLNSLAKPNHRIRTYSGSSFDSSGSLREISDSVTSSSMISVDKQEDFNSMTTMVSRDTEDDHYREPVKEAEVDAQYEVKSVRSVRSSDQQEDKDSDSSSESD